MSEIETTNAARLVHPMSEALFREIFQLPNDVEIVDVEYSAVHKEFRLHTKSPAYPLDMDGQIKTPTLQVITNSSGHVKVALWPFHEAEAKDRHGLKR